MEDTIEDKKPTPTIDPGVEGALADSSKNKITEDLDKRIKEFTNTVLRYMGDPTIQKVIIMKSRRGDSFHISTTKFNHKKSKRRKMLADRKKNK